MHLPRPDLFISATSADLAPMRELVKRAVLDLGAHPIEQEQFAPAGKTVAEMLREKIAASHALIHLVGECYGAENETAPPAREHRAYAEGRRSYTQLEHDLAKQLGKPIYVFICGENFPYREHDPEPEEKRALQDAHRAQFITGAHGFDIVHDEHELRERVLVLDDPVRLVAQLLRETERRSFRTASLGIAAFLLLAGAVWWAIQHANRAQQTADRTAVEVHGELARQREITREVIRYFTSVERPGESLSDEQKFGRALETFALQKKVTVADVRADVELFRREIRALEKTGEADLYDLGLAAFAEKHFVQAAELAERAALAAHAEGRLARERERRALLLAGDAESAAIHHQKAIDHYRAAADLFDREKEACDWAQARQRLGKSLRDHGQYDEGADVSRETLAAAESILGPDDPNMLKTTGTLAEHLFFKSDFAQAEPLFRRVLSAQQRTLGPEHPETLDTASNLAVLLKAKGDYAGAEPLLREALAAQERVLGPEHPDTLIGVNNLAQLFNEKGDYATAEPLFRRALTVRDRILGPDHPQTLSSANDLAGLLHYKHEYPEAEQLFRRALAGHERTLGPEHPDTLSALNGLAYVLKDKHEYTAAEPLFRRAVELRERVSGIDHPDTLICVDNLAELLREKGDYAAAEPLCRRALSGFERQSGMEHYDTLICVHNLARLLEAKGENAEAEANYRRAYTGSDRALGAEHPQTAYCAYDLALFLRKLTRGPEARTPAQQAYRGWLKSNGEQDKDTILARQLLIELGETVE